MSAFVYTNADTDEILSEQELYSKFMQQFEVQEINVNGTKTKVSNIIDPVYQRLDAYFQQWLDMNNWEAW